MAIDLTVVDEQGQAFPAGTIFILVADDLPVGRAELDAAGVAHFEVDTTDVKRLAVRLEVNSIEGVDE